MDWLTDPNLLMSLLTLTVLEVVLGIDNIIFIAILAAKLPESQRPRARLVGLGGAMFMRVALLFAMPPPARRATLRLDEARADAYLPTSSRSTQTVRTCT